MARQILCILTISRTHHEHITQVGGAWGTISREECARQIHSGQETYYVVGGRYRADVEAYQRGGIWYIKTQPDATTKDNLLSLPDCK
jgi:hypothetical protein